MDNNLGSTIFLVYLLLYVIHQNRTEKGNQDFNEIDSNKMNKNGNCQIELAQDLISFGKNNKYVNGIPKIIHYVYKTNYIPSQYSSHVKQCMDINSDVKFVFWTDFSVYSLIFKYFEHEFLVYNSYLDKSSYPLKLSDINRYFILFKFGGIYMDLDTKCQKPFEKVMINDSCILSKEVQEQSRILWNYEYLAMNSLMACIPDHRFFNYILKRLTIADNSSVLEQTGPFMLTKLFYSYSKKFENSLNKSESIVIADAYVFSPLTDTFLEWRCNRKEGGNWRIQGCKDLAKHKKIEKLKEKEAIVVHLFMHLGYEDRKILIQTRDHVCLIFNKIYLIA